MFRRLLKYRTEPDSSDNEQQQNTHFPTGRLPVSGTRSKTSRAHPLADSTNLKKTTQIRNGFRFTVNPSKCIN